MPSALYDYMTAPVIASTLFLSAFVIIPNVSYVNLYQMVWSSHIGS